MLKKKERKSTALIIFSKHEHPSQAKKQTKESRKKELVKIKVEINDFKSDPMNPSHGSMKKK